MKTTEHIIKQYQLLTHWYLSVLADINDQDGSKTLMTTPIVWNGLQDT